jgi:activator of 2-hydroxyglutaryl-CoA dehydratase
LREISADLRGFLLCEDPCKSAVKFEMNDRCAAGTCRFLEMISAALKYELSVTPHPHMLGALGAALPAEE